MTRVDPMLADDLFAGAGGWDLAARALGIHARGVENMPAARATRDAAGLATIHDDVWTFVPDGRAAGEIASPPCPTFSTAGKGTGRKALDSVLRAIDDGAYLSLDRLRAYPVTDDDDRTRLVLTPLHFATGYEYAWLAWKQVPAVLPVWEACAEVLRDRGWNVWTGVVHSEQYGVPQTRKRAFLLASRVAQLAPPTPTHSRYYSRDPKRLDEGVAKWVSMADALQWPASTRVVSNYGSGGDARAKGVRMGDEPSAIVTSKIDRNVVEMPDFLRMTTMPNSAQRKVDQPAPTIAFGHDAASCRWYYEDRDAGLPDWCHERPSTTIVGSFQPEIVASPGYRTTVSRQNAPNSVRISIQEAGILQSFPADFPWQGTKGKQFLQAGNAVPPLMAAAALEVAAGIPATTEERSA